MALPLRKDDRAADRVSSGPARSAVSEPRSCPLCGQFTMERHECGRLGGATVMLAGDPPGPLQGL